MPLTVEDRPIGVYELGAKHSLRSFSSHDCELLETLAARTAIALQNAHSYEALTRRNAQSEHGLQERTSELCASNRQLASSNAELEQANRELLTAQAQLVQSEKMASLAVLVASVAHEINDPVSFIATNVTPLKKRLSTVQDLAAAHADGPLADSVEQVSEILEVIARGAERTTAIVTDVRTFSSPGERSRSPSISTKASR